MKLIPQTSLLIAICFGIPIVGFSQLPTSRPEPTPEVSLENKEQAYAKLMEGQRLLWQSNPSRYRATASANLRNAKQAFQRAVELDPTLAEGYTALAEIALSTPPGNIDDAIGLAVIATKIQPDNFGSHRILAILYTSKSRFTSDSPDQLSVSKAIVEWKEVARLDPRNAEAWAFLSEFYSVGGKFGDQIEALKKWVGSAAPIETQFYRQMMGGRADLSPENASMKLGSALMSAGRADEAIEVLGALVADNPDNTNAIDLLRDALETAGPTSVVAAAESLRQAVFADPGSVALVNLLSQVYSRSGQSDQAIRVLRDAAERSEKADKSTSAQLQVQLGDLYLSYDKIAEGIVAYEKALSVRGIKENITVADADRDFVVQVFEKMIKAYKSVNHPADVRTVIERARKLLKKDDLFSDRQMIEFYRESGRRPDALILVRAIRAKNPSDYGLLRLEASILTESGKVDQGVALIKALVPKPGQNGVATGSGIGTGDARGLSNRIIHDDFTNLLFISHLFMQAGREVEASNAANDAYAAAGSEERKQLAKMTLASAQQMAGDFAAAETTLRAILKQTPGNPIALNNLGYFLLERNERTEEALGLIRRALKVDPTNPSYLDSLGWAQFVLGNLDEAEKDLRMAARIDFGSGTIHEHLGDVYGKQGKADLARSAWQRALDLATNPADVTRLKSKLKK